MQRAKQANILHSIHAVCTYILRPIIKGKQIIIAIVYQQAKRTDNIGRALVALDLRVNIVDRVLQILKADSLRLMGLAVTLLCHRLLNGADDVQRTLLRGFHAVAQEHLFSQKIALICATHLADALHHFLCLARRYEFGSVNTLSKDAKIIKIKAARLQAITAALSALNIHAENIPQRRNIAVYRMAFGYNAALRFQIIRNIPRRNRVVLV